MRFAQLVPASAVLFLSACNPIGPSTGTSGQLYASNRSTRDVVIRTTEANPFGGSKVTVWAIPASGQGFVASLGDATRVEVLSSADCHVLATVDPIRGRVTAVVQNGDFASFEGLPTDSSGPQPAAFQQTTTDCAT